jgi:sugar phosphate isomerase/epimerase
MKKFGFSTHLYHEQRLQQEHLVEIAAHGFEAVEVFATRSHFDYHDAETVLALKRWLAGARLELHSLHAPITDVFANGRGLRVFSTATRNAEARREALAEIASALEVAKTIPYGTLVVHVGVPTAWYPDASDNHRESAVRSVEAIHELAEPLGVRVALEVMGNPLSTAPALVELIDRSFDGANVGVCMDVGHAHLLGDTAEAIETVSEYLFTTHIHDNRGTSDDHLAPFQGSIDWAGTIMAFEKIGYDGVLMYEIAAGESSVGTLALAVSAQERLRGLMIENAMLPLFGTETDIE